MANEYGFGIVDKDGKPPYEGFMACCSNRLWLQQQLNIFNNNHIDPRGPYRVVPLYFADDAAVKS